METPTPRPSFAARLGYAAEGLCVLGMFYVSLSCARFLSRTGEPWGILVWTCAALVFLYGLRLAWCLVRRRPFTARRLRWLFLCQALAWGACLGAPAFREIDAHTWISVGAGSYALLRLVHSFRGEPQPRWWGRWTELVLFNLCLVGVGAELGLRTMAYFVPAPIFDRHDDSAAARIRRFAHPKGRVRHGFPHNSARHYDEEFVAKQPDAKRVLCLGDSFSIGVVPHYYHFTTVAERALGGLELCNMGVPSIGPFEYLHLWRTQGRRLDPDVVVVQIFVGNDVAEAAAHGGKRSLLKNIYDRDNVLLALLPGRLAALRATGVEAGTYDEKSVAFVGRKHRPVEQVPEVLHREYPWLLDPSLEIPAIPQGQFLDIERRRRDAAFGRAGTPGYEAFFAGLEELVAAVSARPLVFVLIPDEFQVHDAVWTALQAADPVPEEDRDLPQRRIGEWLAARGVPCLDLLPTLRAVPPLADGGRHLYHLRDTHFNTRGNEATGKALAAFLRARFAGPLGLK